YHDILGAIPVPPTVRIEPEVKAEKGLRAEISRFFLWRGRGFWVGAIAVASAMFAERLVVARDIVTSIHWYAPTIALMLLGWLGTYSNKSMICVPVPHHAAEGTLPVRVKRVAAAPAARPRPWAVVQRILNWRGDRWRWFLAFIALGLNLYCANQIRQDYYST